MVRLLAIAVISSSLTYVYFGSLAYCFLHLNIRETFEAAGFAFNKVLCSLAIWIHLLINRKRFLGLISYWEKIFSDS